MSGKFKLWTVHLQEKKGPTFMDKFKNLVKHLQCTPDLAADPDFERGLCDQLPEELPRLEGHVLCRFDDVPALLGWDSELTSRTRALLSGQARFQVVHQSLKQLARKVGNRNVNVGKIARHIDDYIALNLHPTTRAFDSSDLAEASDICSALAVGDLDKNRQSGFLA